MLLFSKVYYFVQNAYSLFLAFKLGLFSGLFFPQINYSSENPYSLLETPSLIEPICFSIKNIPPREKDDEDSIPELEKIFIGYGLINVQTLDSTIAVDLRYAGTNNFLSTSLYGNLKRAYLQPDVAQKIVIAQHALHDTLPYYNLIILDAARPQSIQKLMWNLISIPENEKPKYLSKPEYGSLHNFGAAVDVSIIDSCNNLLDMGTPFDSFEELSYPVLESIHLKMGLLSIDQIRNRMLLRKVMQTAGFFNIQTEWWHFNACYRKEARQKYAIIQSHIISENPLLASSSTNNKKDPLDKIAQKADIVFRVQLKTSGKPLSPKSEVFKGLEIFRYYHQGLYKYTAGCFKNFGEAKEYQLKIRELGFDDAFIAAFNHNKRIDIKEAFDILDN